MTKSIAEIIAKAREIDSKATEWPWNIEFEKRDDTWPGVYQLKDGLPLIYGMDGEEGIYADNENDFILIAHARNTHAQLLDALEVAVQEMHRLHNSTFHSLLEATAWMGIPESKREAFIENHHSNSKFILNTALDRIEQILNGEN